MDAGTQADAGFVVDSAQGLIRGHVEGESVAFKGIPYAAAPVGDLRWRLPAPAPSHTGILDATDYGPICTQVDYGTDRVVGQEDCLSLNVWRPVATQAPLGQTDGMGADQQRGKPGDIEAEQHI